MKKSSICIKDYILKYKGNIFVLVLFVTLQTLLTFTIPIITRTLLKEAELGSVPGKYFLYFFIALLAMHASSISYRLFLLKFSLIFKCKEVKNLFKRLFHTKLPFIQSHGPTYFTNRVLNAGNIIFGLIGNCFANALVAIMTVIVAFFFVIMLNKPLFLMFVVLIPLDYFSYRRLNQNLQEKSKELQKISATNMKDIINVVQGFEEIKQISNYNLFSEIVGKYIHNFQKVHNDVNRYAELISSTIQFFISLVKNGILFLTIYYLSNGQMVFADMVFINLIFGIYFGALGNLNRINISRRDVKATIDFINEEIIAQAEDEEKGEILSHIDKITFNIKNFSYTPEQQVLKNINFEIRKGQRIAIVGKVGSGKTTFGKLLMRYHDNPDGIFINDKPLSEYNLKSIRGKVHIVSQNPQMFPGTIRDNITIGLDNINEEKLNCVIEMPFFANLLRELPRGLETNIGEGGFNLSGGQKQKIMIARVLMRNINDIDLIIFDESTSSMDGYSEYSIYKTIDLLLQDKIVIKISHRLSTIKDTDVIVVLKNGEIIDIGTHNNLLRDSREYEELFSSQVIQTL